MRSLVTTVASHSATGLRHLLSSLLGTKLNKRTVGQSHQEDHHEDTYRVLTELDAPDPRQGSQSENSMSGGNGGGDPLFGQRAKLE